jgi:chaperonin GroES
MKITPILNNIVIRPDLSETEKRAQQAGIALPDKQNKEPAACGTVLYVGPGRWADNGTRIPVGVKEGDTVFYHRNFAVFISIGDEKLISVKEEDCQLAISDE